MFKRFNRTGQVAIILLLVIGMGIIFYAASANLGALSQNKLLTTLASNIGASQLGSSMASYGQNTRETMLEGKNEKCKWGGLLGQLIVWYIVVTLAIIGPLTGGSTLAMALAIVAMALSTTSVVLQAKVIEPGFASQWNSMIANTMDTEGAFVETALRTAMGNLATDPVRIEDIHDDDQDRVWGFDDFGEPKDMISRLGDYYTARLKTVELTDSTPITNFYDTLWDLVFADRSMDGPLPDWGIHDPLLRCYKYGGDTFSECNPCCVPEEFRPYCCGCYDRYLINDQDFTACEDQELQCGDAATCAENSFYPGYQYVYDAFLENFTNESYVYSFRELIGRDDEHKLYSKNPDDPNEAPQRPTPATDAGFHLEDTTGFYLPPYYDPDVTEMKVNGVFPFLYKIADWGVDLTALDYATHPEHCYWYDPGEEGSCDFTLPAAELDSKRLDLPHDLGDSDLINDHPYVDSTLDNLPAPNPPWAPDKIALPADGAIVASNTQCAQNVLNDPPIKDIGFWKRGTDRYCSDGDAAADSWPYDKKCDKYAGDGACDALDADLWPDDVLDDMDKELVDFIRVTRDNILSMDTDTLVKTFDDWYDDIAPWIEDPDDPAHCAVLCGTGEQGRLRVLRDKIQGMLDRLLSWRDSSYAGSSCYQVWCVPPEKDPDDLSNRCSGLSATDPLNEEEETFDSNTATPQGDMQEVIDCLDWNVNDNIPGVSPPVIGNAQKFQRCKEACDDFDASGYADPDLCALANDICSELPRSLIAGFNSSNYTSCNVNAGEHGSCGDILSFRDKVEDSAREAENQVAKFEQRRDFLEKRLGELNSMIDILQRAYDTFDAFLSGPTSPVDALILARKNFDDSRAVLPNQLIYGWQDPDTPEREGYWHIVRLDAAVPGNCGGGCNVDQDPSKGDPEWPKLCVREDLFHNCYYMCDDKGVAKFRATRWDEDRDEESPAYPRGAPIWNFNFFHPDRDDKIKLDGYVTTLKNNCGSLELPNPPASLLPLGYPADIYQGAFILTKREWLDNSAQEYCWDAAMNILMYGISTATCIEYYEHTEGDKHGMGFHFVPCQHF